MNPVIEDLARCFRNLNDEQLGNLRWHLDNGTNILCGTTSAFRYVDDAGAGCPAVLANTREVSRFNDLPAIDKVLYRLNDHVRDNDDHNFLIMLSKANQEEVREAIEKVLGEKSPNASH